MPGGPDLPSVPPGFLWGTATAGAQIEGALPAADWEIFTTAPAIRRRLRTIGRLVGVAADVQPYGPAVRHFNAEPRDHLRFVHEDLDRAEALGLNAYRFSVEWSRVQPGPRGGFDPAAVAYYQDVARAALARGMTPIVTLNHLSLPRWILTPPRVGLLRLLLRPESDPAYGRRRGWLDEATIDAFLAFVRVIVPALMEVGARIFITFNEPVATLIGVGYIAGLFPPGLLLAGQAAQRAYWHILAAHRRAYDLIKQLPGGSETQIGIAVAILHVEPALDAEGRVSRRDRRAARQFDYFCNLHMLDTLILGRRDGRLDYRHAPRSRATAPNAPSSPAPRLDFVGVNYYRRVHVAHRLLLAWRAPFAGGAPDADRRAGRGRSSLRTEAGYEVFPAGLSAQLRRLHRRYNPAFTAATGRPLRFCVTENGLGEAADANRAPYLIAHVEQILAAIGEGIDVFGYLYWSLMDNWEWISHYQPMGRHGVFSVDRSRPEAPRYMTDAGMALAQLVAAGGIGRTRERFGAFSADGATMRPPTLSAGRLYAGRLTAGDRRQDFELYLSACADGSWLGLLYYFPADGGAGSDRWARLATVAVAGSRVTFAHPARRGPAPAARLDGGEARMAGAGTYAIDISGDALALSGHATVAGLRWRVAADLQPLGLYLPPAVPGDPPRGDGAGDRGGRAWAPLVITRYQHNRGLSNARQLLDMWRRQVCPPPGPIVPFAGQITLALRPALPAGAGPGPKATIQQARFTGRALVNRAGETILVRAPDGLEI